MNENKYFSYLAMGLPENIERLKMCGEFDEAIRLIDTMLADELLPEEYRYSLLAEREMIRRLPLDFPFTRAEALEKIWTHIPSYTEAEFDARLAAGQIRFIYVHGEMRIFDRFFESMCKSMPDFRACAGAALSGGESGGKGSTGDLRLNRAMQRMKEKGQLSNRICIRASVKLKEDVFTPGMFVRVHLPIPTACTQQSEIRIEAMSPEGGRLAPEEAEQRTVCWEETMQENHEFSVTYSYVHTATWHDTAAAWEDRTEAQKCHAVKHLNEDFRKARTATRPEATDERTELECEAKNDCLPPEALPEYEDDTQEIAPHVRFTPFIRALAEACIRGDAMCLLRKDKADVDAVRVPHPAMSLLCEDQVWSRTEKGMLSCMPPLEKARRFYDYITLNFKYTYMPAYFSLENIAEECARSKTGDCGVFALLFLTLCRCAGIPAEWQSGFAAEPDFLGGHDWVRFYAEPFGWLYADPSYGIAAVRAENEERRQFYFGNLDPYRMVANRAFQAPFTVEKQYFRADPYDNQLGEIETAERGLRWDEFVRTKEIVSFEEL